MASDVRLNTERIDAVVAETRNLVAEETRPEYAARLLAAADAAGSWNDTERLRARIDILDSQNERLRASVSRCKQDRWDTERLRTALTDALRALRNVKPALACDGWPERREAIERVDSVIASARAALAESVPSPPAKAAR